MTTATATTATTATTALKLAGAFRSQALFDSGKDSATAAASILANAELPVAAVVLAPRLEKLLSALAGLDEALSDRNQMLTPEAVAALVGSRRTAETMLKEARTCLLAVALDSVARMGSIAPLDRPALCEVILARVAEARPGTADN